jgi:hypothetical protein
MLAIGPSAAVENTGAAQQSASTQDAVIFYGEWKQHVTVRKL